jgi:acyl carrier protein
MHTSSIERDIRGFIEENFLFRGDNQSLGEAESLLDAGLVDSTGVLELVSFLEGHFGLHIPDAEMTPENLDSICGLVAYVGTKLGTTAAA